VKTMRGSKRVGRTAITLSVLAVALMLAPAAHAAEEGISGSVVHGTKATPVADAPVRIDLFDDQSQIGTGKTTTAADGTFSFAPPQGTTGFQAGAAYLGQEYRAPAQAYTSGQVNEVTIRVFDTTKDAADVALTQWVVWLDHEGDALAVQQDFAWSNGGNAAYVGEGDAVVTVPLAPGADNVQFLGTFLEQQGSVQNDTYVSQAPIVPGDSTATIRYTAPTVTRLSLPVTVPTQDFQLYVPEDLVPQGNGLRLAGTISDQGVTYQEYVTAPLAPGQTLEVTLVPGETGGSGSNATVLLLAVAAVALLAGVAFFLVGRRRRSRTPAMQPRQKGPQRAKTPPARANAKASRGSAPKTRPTRRPEPARHLNEPDDDEAQLLIDEIAALDLSFERGLLDERTYRRLRVAAKDRLLALKETARGGIAR
jgi:hypothetical protein